MSSPADPPARAVSEKEAAPAPSGDFFVVGVGASAGGLGAVSEVLKRLQVRCNLAVVIVQHLDPDHESILVELLHRATPLPVQWATHGLAVEPGNVYVAPRQKWVSIRQGVLLLRELDHERVSTAVDRFFQALADDCRHRAVGVVLSGDGADGRAGAKAIKGAGGIVFAQEPFVRNAVGKIDKPLLRRGYAA